MLKSIKTHDPFVPNDVVMIQSFHVLYIIIKVHRKNLTFGGILASKEDDE